MVNTQRLPQDLIQPKEKQPKFLKYFPQNINNSAQFTYALTTILKGEYLNKN